MTEALVIAKNPFFACVKDEADLTCLREFARLKGFNADACVVQGDISLAATYLKSNPSPAVLVVQIGEEAEAAAQLDALADVCDPQTKVIVTGKVNQYSFYCWLMDLGLSSYLLLPLTPTALEEAYGKATQTPASMEKSEKKAPAVIFGVMGARGGVGASTVALNLAALFAARGSGQIALVDLDAQFGTAALMLDLVPSHGLREALEKPDRIDSLFIERVMQRANPHFSVLGAEEPLSERIHVQELAAELLLGELAKKFDVIVLDIPRRLSPFNLMCMRQTEQMLLVSELTLPCLRDVLRFSEYFRTQLKMKPPLVVANKCGMAPKLELLAADFEEGIKQKITQKLPFAPELFMSMDIDAPTVKEPQHAAAKALKNLSSLLLKTPDVGDEKKGKTAGKRGLLNALTSKKA